MSVIAVLGIAVCALSVVAAAAIAAAVWYAIVFPRQTRLGPLPRLTGADTVRAERLASHLRAIASEPHNLAYPAALERVAAYIETTLASFGYTVQAQAYAVGADSVRNIEVMLAASDATNATPTYVIGAHYDSPDDSPGANDNGSGVAALLEIARYLSRYRATHATLRLVFFVNEELPYGKTPDMGSWRHAKMLRERGTPVVGMMALETLGYFSERPGSQVFPWPFGHVYSDVGNFVAFVGLPGARPWVHRAVKAFRQHKAFPSIAGVAPGFLEGIDLSDHWAYAEFGFPALMVTDTAPFRNPYYHTTADRPDTVDTDSLARIASALRLTLIDLAELVAPADLDQTRP